MTDPKYDRRVVPRWEYQHTDDTAKMEELLDTGWEPFAVGDEKPLVLHFKKQVWNE